MVKLITSHSHRLPRFVDGDVRDEDVEEMRRVMAKLIRPITTMMRNRSHPILEIQIYLLLIYAVERPSKDL